MSATGWTPVDETAAKWTPVDENLQVASAPQQQPSTYSKLTAGYNPNVEDWAQKHPFVGPIVRFLDATGGAALKSPEAIAKGIADAARIASSGGIYSGGNPTGTAQSVAEGVQGWADPNIRRGALSVLPEALGQGVGSVAGAETLAVPLRGSAPAEVTPASRLRAQLDHAHQVSGQPPLPTEIPQPGFFPSTTRAGAALQDVKATAGSVPIDMSKPGATALELYTQSQRGATLPKAVRDLVNRTTKPDSAPLTYAEAKDFQSNISRLSANERMNLTPATSRLVGQLNQDLKASLQDAADTAGKGEQFQQAMQEYHNAMRLQGYKENMIDAAWKGALGWLGVSQLKRIFGP